VADEFGQDEAPKGAHGSGEVGHVSVLLKEAIDFLAVRRGGSYIDATAIAVLTQVSGVASPDGSPNGQIIITAVPEPTTLALVSLGGLSLLLLRRKGPSVQRH